MNMKNKIAILILIAGFLAVAQSSKQEPIEIGVTTGGVNAFHFKSLNQKNQSFDRVRISDGPWLNAPFTSSNIVRQLLESGEVCKVGGHCYRSGRRGELGGLVYADFHQGLAYSTCSHCGHAQVTTNDSVKIYIPNTK